MGSRPMSWHGDGALFRSYARGETDEARALSLEAHVLECPGCRERIAAFAPTDRLAGVWRQVAAGLDAPRAGLVERLLARCGVPDHVARLLAATPSLRVSWFAALGVALGFAVLAAHTGTGGLLLFLVLAPLAPLAGVGAAYGPGIDPAYEIGVAAPMRSFRLLLIRAVAVLGTSLLLAGAAAFALPRLSWTSAAWLLPSMSLAAASLALSTFWPPVSASIGLTLAWIAVVLLVKSVSGDTFAAFRPSAQIAWLLLTGVSVLILVHRRERFEVNRGR